MDPWTQTLYLCKHNQNFQRLTIYLSGFDSNQLYFPSALHLQTVHCTFPLTLEIEIKCFMPKKRKKYNKAVLSLLIYSLDRQNTKYEY